jgi:hypothetical protein
MWPPLRKRRARNSVVSARASEVVVSTSRF